MTPLEIIALINALLQAVGPIEDAIAKYKAILDSPGLEMTEAEIAAYEALKASDHAKPYWQED